MTTGPVPLLIIFGGVTLPLLDVAMNTPALEFWVKVVPAIVTISAVVPIALNSNAPAVDAFVIVTASL